MTVVYLTRPIEVKPQKKKVVVFPLWRRVLNAIQSYRNDIRNRKIQFLLNQAYQEFYNAQVITEKCIVEENGDEVTIKSVDIPYFIIEQQRRKIAYDEAVKALLNVIKDGRLNECYKSRIKELKKGY